MDVEDFIRAVRRIDPSIDSNSFGPLDALYSFRLFFGRRPDPAGWSFWSRQEMELEKAVRIFQSSDEGRLRSQSEPRAIRTRRGFEIFIDPTDVSVGRAIAQALDYEPNVSSAVLRHLAGKEGTFVDIGANIGWYMLLAHVASPRLDLVGFEPNPNNVQLCLRSLERRGLVQAKVYPFALSDRDRFLGLRFVGSNGSVGETTPGAMITKGVRGDDYLGGSPVRMIKIDVEGHEPLALEGLRGTIRRDRPMILTEFHPHSLRESSGLEPEQYLSQVIELGYSLAVIERDAAGTETPCTGIAEVMSAWNRHNAEQSMKGELHLDLLARPR